jgi:hypothetical protein
MVQVARTAWAIAEASTVASTIFFRFRIIVLSPVGNDQSSAVRLHSRTLAISSLISYQYNDTK